MTKTIVTKTIGTLVLGIIVGMLSAYCYWVSNQFAKTSRLDADMFFVEIGIAIFVVSIAPNAYLSVIAFMMGHAMGFLRTCSQLQTLYAVDKIDTVPDYYSWCMTPPLAFALITLVVRRFPHWLAFVIAKIAKPDNGVE